MIKIVLLCAAGMSTSALVRKMKDAAKAENYECDIVQGQLPNNKVEVIDMKDYGMMNGKGVLDHVRKVLEG